MVWDIKTSNGMESKKIVWEVAPYLRGQGLDLGAGMFKVLPHVIAVDNGHHEAFGHNIQPDVRVKTAEKLDVFASSSMDFVFSSHLLEHIIDYKAALKEWWRVVKQGGYLVLYLPDEDEYPKVGEPGANPDHKWNVNYDKIMDAMKSFGSWNLVKFQKRNEENEYSLLFVFKKTQGSIQVQSWAHPKPEKTVLVCRFGAYGDLMQASSVFAGLKQQGYHVTLMTSPPGVDVVTNDPNIDEFMLLDKDQVPNADLANFWKHQAKNYDKFVNLSESVEGTWLALPGRTNHTWNPIVRHMMLNRNYLEFQHLLAGVPHKPQVKFFPTLEEKAWARKQREKTGRVTVVWSLAGSSVHKTWAGLDTIIARILLEFADVHIVLVGGHEGIILEQGWENEPRVKCTSGKWTMRQTLSFVETSDMVIGPETGVLNAAACLEIPKVVFLSHSTDENLTRDWINTTALFSKGTVCQGRGTDEAPACHVLHYGWTNCTQDKETGTAQCQKDISVDEVWYHTEFYLSKIKELQAAA